MALLRFVFARKRTNFSSCPESVDQGLRVSPRPPGGSAAHLEKIADIEGSCRLHAVIILLFVRNIERVGGGNSSSRSWRKREINN